MPQKDAPKQFLPVIVNLKRWREENGLSQSEAFRVLNEAGINVTLDSLQNLGNRPLESPLRVS
jgi:hypothetical protein